MISLALAVLLTCPPWGDAAGAATRHQNALKNRTGEPVQFAPVTVAEMLSSKDGTWAEGAAGELVGWVVARKRELPESCNCHDAERRDWHLLVSGRKSDTKPSRCVVVEVTPHYHLQIPAVGSHVRVRGWFFLDSRHKGEPGRGTCYELHPVTSIEYVNVAEAEWTYTALRLR